MYCHAFNFLAEILDIKLIWCLVFKARMEPVGVVSLHESRYLKIGILETIKLINTNTFILEDSVEGFNVSIFVRCSTWNSLMVNIYFYAAVFKYIADKLWTIVSSDNRLCLTVKKISLD